ncbi:T9SS type A sorting domain-containing protein [Neolewinella persica]|uniref:T9SS type A sorting domain-containing protein n=1 Tax=Neolewinella persica TaxID=70998 RepID=UPI0003A357BF|nr:T9SS type A sorting domain-containing protein [Neolewinella persica]
MLRFLLPIVMLIMTSLSLFSQEEIFRKYYGLPYPWAEEKGFSIEKTGEDAFVLIGTRENAESSSNDIAFWTIGPTGGFIDSTVWALPKHEELLETFGGPDGGFLVVYNSGYYNEQDTVNLAYFNADGSLSWNQSLIDHDDLRGGIRGLDFISSTEVVLVYAENGDFPETAPKVASVSATEGLVPLFTYLNNGFSEIWSLERQTDGNLLMTGGRGDEVFVTLVTLTGEVLWEQLFKYAVNDPNARAYEFLSSAHRPPGDSVIVVAGRRDLSRAFITMDTLGNRIEEHLISGLTDFHEGERATWYGKNKVFINNPVDQYYQLIELNNYVPTNTFVEESRYVDGFELFGSYYIESRDIMLSALYDDGDQAFSRFDNSDQSLTFFKGGSAWYDDEENARGIVALPDGKLLLQTVSAGPDGQAGISFWTIDSLGELLVERTVVNNGAFVVPTRDGNFLIHHRNNTGLVVTKADPAGNELWRAEPETDQIGFRSNFIADLGQGEFAFSESKFTIDDEGSGYFRSRVVYADSTGAELNSFYTERTGFFSCMQVDQEGNLLIAGSSYEDDSTLVVSYDLTSGVENWRNTYQIPNFNFSSETKLLSMRDGAIGVLNYIGRRGSIEDRQLDFRKLGADGADLGRIVIESGHFIPYGHQLAQRPNGKVTLVFGYNTRRVGDPQLLRVVEVDPVAMTLVNTFEFSNFYTSIYPADIAFVDTARTAVIATGYASETSISSDVFVIVFDSEGNITDIRGQEALPLEVTMSPNPTPDVLWITTSGTATTGPLSVELFDVSGQQLVRKEFTTPDQTELDLRPFAAGTYFVLVRDQQGRSVTRKVIKQ